MIFTEGKLEKVISSSFRSRLIIAIAGALIIFLSGCKKSIISQSQTSILEAYFAENVLNKNFIVDLATDNGTDLTSQYTGYTFVLTKTTSYYSGPLTGTKGSANYTGTWESNSDYSKLIISLTTPSVPAEFIFLNRSWKFTKKSIPVLELAPWGSTDPKVLHMKRV